MNTKKPPHRDPNKADAKRRAAGSTTISFSTSKQLQAAIDRKAAQERRTRSQWITIQLERLLNQEFPDLFGSREN